ncbi:MAG: hypothetical protein IKA22_09885 [Lentisphaeria bacterium]|nr:hypothetical protein [Lentisphaeria bacterium]
MKKIAILTIMALVVSNSFAVPFDAQKAIAELKSSGQKITIGKSSSTGIYILCRETVEIKSGDLALAQEAAKMQARAAIAEFMQTKVSAVSTTNTVTKFSVQDDDESFESAEFMKKCASKEASQIQRGVTICQMEKRSDKLTVYCLLTENVIDASAVLEKTMKKLGPNTVQVSGMAFFGDNISRQAAEKTALNEAHREAIAQVLGMSLVSSSARQTISKETVDNDGQETFDCDDSFKAKVFSSAAGFVESSRIVDKKVEKPTVIITIVAKVAKDKLMDDYRSFLESMGNPGFCVRSNDQEMLELYSGFFGNLGLRMVDNLRDAAYIIDVYCQFSGQQAAVRVVVRDKVNENVLFSQENDPEEFTAVNDSASSKTVLCRKILRKMRPHLHSKLNTFIGRANADGRKIQVRILNYDDDYHRTVKIIEKSLKGIPGVSNVRMKITDDKVIYTLNYKSETEDLADLLEKQIKVDVRRRSMRPVRSNVDNTLVEFSFE